MKLFRELCSGIGRAAADGVGVHACRSPTWCLPLG